MCLSYAQWVWRGRVYLELQNTGSSQVCGVVFLPGGQITPCTLEWELDEAWAYWHVLCHGVVREVSARRNNRRSRPAARCQNGRWCILPLDPGALKDASRGHHASWSLVPSGNRTVCLHTRVVCWLVISQYQHLHRERS